MKKLKDKATVDGQINQVSILFPDQFGRMHSLQIDAEHFLEEMEKGEKTSQFIFQQNPFKSDIAGKDINFDELLPDVKL